MFEQVRVAVWATQQLVSCSGWLLVVVVAVCTCVIFPESIQVCGDLGQTRVIFVRVVRGVH